MSQRGSEKGGWSYRVAGEGLCPKCGGVGSYTYILSLKRGGEGDLLVGYTFECPFCGYSEKSKVIIPVRAAYYLRFLFRPEVMVEIEKVWHLLKLKARRGECVGGGCVAGDEMEA